MGPALALALALALVLELAQPRVPVQPRVLAQPRVVQPQEPVQGREAMRRRDPPTAALAVAGVATRAQTVQAMASAPPAATPCVPPVRG